MPPRHLWDTWDLNTGPHAWTASTLSTDPSPQPLSAHVVSLRAQSPPSHKNSPNVEIEPYLTISLLDITLICISQAWDYQLLPSLWAFVPQNAVKLVVL